MEPPERIVKLREEDKSIKTAINRLIHEQEALASTLNENHIEISHLIDVKIQEMLSENPEMKVYPCHSIWKGEMVTMQDDGSKVGLPIKQVSNELLAKMLLEVWKIPNIDNDYDAPYYYEDGHRTGHDWLF